MRRWTAVLALVLVILAGVAIGVGAYHAGYNHGLEASGRVTQIVREVGPGGFGFGFILFPLFFFLLQWPLVHGLAVLVGLLRGQSVAWLFGGFSLGAPLW